MRLAPQGGKNKICKNTFYLISFKSFVGQQLEAEQLLRIAIRNVWVIWIEQESSPWLSLGARRAMRTLRRTQ